MDSGDTNMTTVLIVLACSVGYYVGGLYTYVYFYRLKGKPSQRWGEGWWFNNTDRKIAMIFWFLPLLASLSARIAERLASRTITSESETKKIKSGTDSGLYDEVI
jgi:hypothetical protein